MSPKTSGLKEMKVGIYLEGETAIGAIKKKKKWLSRPILSE